MSKLENLSGQRFGRLVVKELCPERTASGKPQWVAQCDCGNVKIAVAPRLKNGQLKSCGCLWAENVEQLGEARQTQGGLSKHPIANNWYGIVSRCNDPTHKDYKDYGGRGIKVCARWSGTGGLENFIADMETSYQEGLTVDRRDLHGDYTPQNCRWATAKEQMRNTRRTRWVDTPKGKMSLAEAAETFGESYQALSWRFKRGWPMKLIFQRWLEANPQ